MYPAERMWSGGEEWREAPRFGPYGEYGSYPGVEYSERLGYGYGHGAFQPREWQERFRGRYDRFEGPREHVWRGGLLGWLGSGVRAGAEWVGQQMQSWGALLGGKLKGTSDELGRAMRGRGEQVGSAMEHRGEELSRERHRGAYEGRPSRSYRRPDERILDDVHQRIAISGIDADEVEIEVTNGVVKLSGRVPRRFDKRLVEDIAEQVFGVQEVQNQLRLARRVEENPGGVAPAANGGAGAFGGASRPS